MSKTNHSHYTLTDKHQHLATSVFASFILRFRKKNSDIELKLTDSSLASRIISSSCWTYCLQIKQAEDGWKFLAI